MKYIKIPFQLLSGPGDTVKPIIVGFFNDKIA